MVNQNRLQRANRKSMSNIGYMPRLRTKDKKYENGVHTFTFACANVNKTESI